MPVEDVAGILEQARVTGIKLWAVGSKLHFRAPAGAVSPSFRAQLRSHRDEIVAALTGPLIAPLGRVDRVPLLPSSLQYWADVQNGTVNPGVMNRTHFVAKWTGELNISALERSLQSMVERHPILAARVAESNGRFEFVFDHQGSSAIERVDLTQVRMERLEQQARTTIATLVWTAFDLSRPLFRAFIVKLSKYEHIAGFVVHHFIADRWSVRLATSELIGGYEHFCGRADPPAMPSIQYSDYVAAMCNWLNSSAAEYRISFWKRVMAGAPCTQLRADDESIDYLDSELECTAFELGPALAAAVEALSRRSGVMVSTIVLAAHLVALAKHGGATDMVCRVVFSGRENSQLARMIGNVINFLPVRFDLSLAAGQQELFHHVEQAIMAALEHHLPCELLQPVLREVGASEITPLFNFTTARAASQPSQESPVRIEHMQISAPRSRSRLALLETFVIDDGRDIRGDVWYAHGRYGKATIARFIGSFREVLGQFVG